MDQKTGLSESLEDYLETILGLEQSQKVARAKDIADRMGVLRGSVTGALKSLAEKGLINYEPYSFITLTPKGAAIAGEVARRHKAIKAFLQNVLLLEEESADENACRMEHAMDKDAIDRLVQFIEYIDQCPRAGDDWVKAFVNYYPKGKVEKEKCLTCLESCLDRYQAQA
ncbi:MAG: metal-dependent transcriptional regulator [Desulfobacterales bacterium]|nr:metal-dependent transcriptional regulator [Desulfobacterales bacterium]